MRFKKNVLTLVLICCIVLSDNVYASGVKEADVEIEFFEGSDDQVAMDQIEEALAEEIEITKNDFENMDIGIEDKISAFAAGIDLKVDNLTISGSTPLIPYEKYSYTVSISNAGSTTASNVKMRIIHNSNIIDTVNIGTVPGNSSGTVNFTYGGLKHGANVMAIVLDPNNELPDINRNNNSIYKTFNATGRIDLVAAEVKAHQIQETAQQTIFIFSVTNVGTAPAGNFQVAIYIDGEQAGTMNVDGLDSYHKYTSYFGVKFYHSGTHTVRMVVDPNNLITESNKTNNTASSSLEVPQNTDLWAGRQSDPANITVNISASAAELYERSTLSSYLDWNNRTSRVNFAKPTYSTHNNSTNSTIDVFTEEMIDTTLAYCHVYHDERRVTDYFNDTSSYTKAVIYLDSRTDKGLLSYTDENRRIKTIRHEFGHALGLAHPTCSDTAIMHQGYGNTFNSTNVTAHDVHNLISKYN